jgi:molybdate transport system regulatory protein
LPPPSDTRLGIASPGRYQKRVETRERTVTSRASRLDVTIRFANGGSLTPEVIALIDAIRASRSILGASRATGVSYRKCWLMVDALNRTFETPVFATFPGRRGSGAELTDFGERLVALYRSMERRARSASAQGLVELTASLDASFRPRSSFEAQGGDQAQPRPSRLRRS